MKSFVTVLLFLLASPAFAQEDFFQKWLALGNHTGEREILRELSEIKASKVSLNIETARLEVRVQRLAKHRNRNSSRRNDYLQAKAKFRVARASMALLQNLKEQKDLELVNNRLSRNPQKIDAETFKTIEGNTNKIWDLDCERYRLTAYRLSEEITYSSFKKKMLEKLGDKASIDNREMAKANWLVHVGQFNAQKELWKQCRLLKRP